MNPKTKKAVAITIAALMVFGMLSSIIISFASM